MNAMLNESGNKLVYDVVSKKKTKLIGAVQLATDKGGLGDLAGQ
jgi:hypothetical protein